MADEILLLGPARRNVGVFTPATVEAADLGVLCLNSGLIHHVGPHRLYVLLARALAAQGIPSLRFDLSGIGDSPGRGDDLPADEVPITEILEAVAALEARGLRRFILFGICSGALHAARAAMRSQKISGLILVNSGIDPQTQVDYSEYLAQFYLQRSARNPRAWRNLLTGKVNLFRLAATLISAAANRLTPAKPAAPSLEQELVQAISRIKQNGTSILALLSDRHAQFYQIFRAAIEPLQDECFSVVIHADADHLYASLPLQQELIQRVCEWSRELVASEVAVESTNSVCASASTTPGAGDDANR